MMVSGRFMVDSCLIDDLLSLVVDCSLLISSFFYQAHGENESWRKSFGARTQEVVVTATSSPPKHWNPSPGRSEPTYRLWDRLIDRTASVDASVEPLIGVLLVQLMDHGMEIQFNSLADCRTHHDSLPTFLIAQDFICIISSLRTSHFA